MAHSKAVEFVARIRHHGIQFASGVPDSLLSSLSRELELQEAFTHVSAPNEGLALSVAMGHYLGSGKIPMIYLQNSGIGNLVNPLMSLFAAEVFHIPALLVLGWRGEDPAEDEPQHRAQGPATIPMLSVLGVQVRHLTRDSEVSSVVSEGCELARTSGLPAAILVSKGALGEQFVPPSSDNEFSRRAAITIVHEGIDSNNLVVATTGKTAREVYELQSPIERERSFLTVGGMGHASSVALGLHEARRERSVVCIDGDGSLQMHMGSLAMIGARQPKRFLHILIDNGVHESVGGQAVSNPSLDYVGLAISCGYQTAVRVNSPPSLRQALINVRRTQGPHLIAVSVAQGSSANLGRPAGAPAEWKEVFMDGLMMKPDR